MFLYFWPPPPLPPALPPEMVEHSDIIPSLSKFSKPSEVASFLGRDRQNTAVSSTGSALKPIEDKQKSH